MYNYLTEFIIWTVHFMTSGNIYPTAYIDTMFLLSSSYDEETAQKTYSNRENLRWEIAPN